jgi:hypothetical protein
MLRVLLLTIRAALLERGDLVGSTGGGHARGSPLGIALSGWSCGASGRVGPARCSS